MNFFLAVHQSIFEPAFYKDTVISAPKRFVAGYFFKLLIASALVMGAAQVYYLLDEQRGLAGPLQAAFGSMEIKNGELHPGTETPFVPATYLIFPVFEKISGMYTIFSEDFDSLLIVDTSSQLNYSLKVPVIILKKTEVLLLFNTGVELHWKYVDILSNNKNFKFTKEEINNFLRKNTVRLFQNFFFTNLFMNLGSLVLSIVLLGGAAYIFRVEKKITFKKYLKAASFAITPLTIGNVLVALSGVKFSWTWQILIFISTLVMFRAIVAIGTSSDKPNEVI